VPVIVALLAVLVVAWVRLLRTPPSPPHWRTRAPTARGRPWPPGSPPR
jgi:hypothetical protein